MPSCTGLAPRAGRFFINRPGQIGYLVHVMTTAFPRSSQALALLVLLGFSGFLLIGAQTLVNTIEISASEAEVIPQPIPEFSSLRGEYVPFQSYHTPPF